MMITLFITDSYYYKNKFFNSSKLILDLIKELISIKGFESIDKLNHLRR
jgi:hypothetical protein